MAGLVRRVHVCSMGQQEFEIRPRPVYGRLHEQGKRPKAERPSAKARIPTVGMSTEIRASRGPADFVDLRLLFGRSASGAGLRRALGFNCFARHLIYRWPLR
jgi:hypothetical protein